MVKYDASSKSSIMAAALTILGKSVRQLYPNAISSQGGTGNFGNSVEFYHFGIRNNNNPEPDFGIIGYDLKCTPLDPTEDGYIAGERLVLTMIDFVKEAQINHYTESHFWKKAKLLIIFYLRIKGGDYLDFIVQMIRWWDIPQEDLKIIIDDWEKIHNKLKNGQAHLLSEGDTLYLGACTKSSDSSKRTNQFGINAPKAKPRAYCLKKQYMYWLVVDSYLDKKNVHINPTMNLDKKYMNKIIEKKRKLGLAVKSISEYEKHETFEDYIGRKFQPFIGKTIDEISNYFGTDIDKDPKQIAYTTSKLILGVKEQKISEFEKAGIIMKTITLENSMSSVRQSMSFFPIKWTELALETNWEDSRWHDVVTSRFFFVVFQKGIDEKQRNNYVFKGTFFWAMPTADEAHCEFVWQDTKNKVLLGDYENFVGMASDPICHVRPHDAKALYNTPTPQGTLEKKKCFWLKNSYIFKIVKENLLDKTNISLISQPAIPYSFGDNEYGEQKVAQPQSNFYTPKQEPELNLDFDEN